MQQSMIIEALRNLARRDGLSSASMLGECAIHANKPTTSMLFDNLENFLLASQFILGGLVSMTSYDNLLTQMSSHLKNMLSISSRLISWMYKEYMYSCVLTCFCNMSMDKMNVDNLYIGKIKR